MATVYKWTPFGVALDITATGGTVTRTSATRFKVTINVSWETYYSGAKTNYGMKATAGTATSKTATLNSFGTNASSGSGQLTDCEFMLSGNGASTQTITVYFTNFNTDNGDSATNTVKFNVNVPAWTSYKITYSGNGGAGVPAAQTKWKGQSLLLSGTKPTKTGYTFLGWGTSYNATTATYQPQGNYTADGDATLYAVWKANTYTVTYNANGGTGAPAAQTKTYGTALTLSSTKPTRSKYTFLGWGTSAAAKTATYSAGGSYTTNASVTLYAVWELAYVKPRISNLTVFRCDSSGTQTDEGTYAKVAFNWATDEPVTSIKIDRKGPNDTTWTSITLQNKNGTSGAESLTTGSGTLEINTSYTIRVTVADSLGSNTASVILPSQFFTMDFNEGGTAAAFGGEADVDNTLKNNFDLLQTGNRYSYQPSAFDGEKGYTLLATVKVTQLNANTPITFVISKRSSICPMTVHATFASSSSTLDPELESFVYEGDNFGAFFCKTAASTWNLYVDNLSGYQNPCLQDWYTSKTNADRIEVTFPSEQVTTLPQPWYRAIPAQMRSILDYIYPVGSIYICYSHASPADMFGGTWVRIENAFLWGVDSSGTIGTTGGEKTHTLTVNELPEHTHGSVYSQHADGTKNYPWLASGGTSLAYGTVSTGGGAAHNNMPPYIQVSIWRRAA